MSVYAERPQWHAQAECHGGTAVNVFFPERGGEAATSRAMCAVCPVREECLNFALENGEKFGIWGGKSERERRVMRRVRTFGTTVAIRTGEHRPCSYEGCDFVAVGAAGSRSHIMAHRRADDFAAQRSAVAS